MEWYNSAILIFGFFLLLLFSGLHVGISFASTGIVGLLFFQGGKEALSQVIRIIHDSFYSYGLLAIPLFILMAELLESSGANRRLFNAVQMWFRWLPGSLPTSGMITCGIFGAACGSSLAATASLGKLMFTQMIPRGVDKELIAGVVTAGGSLSLLIPPSLGFILYGVLTEASVGRLFIAGIIPGVILVGIFSVYIIIRAFKNPKLAPRISEQHHSFIELIKLSKGAIPIFIVIISVLGSIYTGITTPNEAGAIGSFLAIIIGMITKELTWSKLSKSIFTTLSTTGLIMFILIGGQIFTRLIALQGIGHAMSRTITDLGLSPYLILFFITIMYLILGMLMDGISITILTVPIIVPILAKLGFDIIWFGVYLIILIEIGLLTPPVGLNLYVVQNLASPYGLHLWGIIRGSFPFVVLMILFLILLIFFPNLALWLPATMK